ncbi:hypothetical protein HF521_002221 [Silurus meridionalis]|uniref:Uncharacterized protein n=1 Tax=Silurus meridionalis TaxID=175797 RepID=A0A8T0B8H2_SILME|nr:hypothetical protein HF521_002221 [Silurus meridionalis]
MKEEGAGGHLVALFQESSALENRSWGEIMDELDNEMENLQPFCIDDPWSINTFSHVEEQMVEEQKVDKPMVEVKKKVEEQKEPAKVPQQPVFTKKLPKKRLSKNTKVEEKNLVAC